MGRTCKCVATKISASKGAFHIWQKELFYVTISRVECLSNLLFVGSKTDTINAIKYVLQIKNSTTEYIAALLAHLDILSSQTPRQPCLIRNFCLPDYDVSCVYFLISSVSPHTFILNHTHNFTDQLSNQNTRSPINNDVNSLIPWVPAAIITGFHGNHLSTENQLMREDVKSEWQHLINDNETIQTLDLMQLGAQALANVQYHNNANFSYFSLKFISFL
jgi:hypothetical protein